jgi:hypothetical protein
VVRKDGTIVGGEYNESWVEIFRILSAQPLLFQSFDMVRIFKHIARIMGAKDINEFVMQNGQAPQVNTQVADQETIDKGVQTGNMVPVAEMMGGGQGA